MLGFILAVDIEAALAGLIFIRLNVNHWSIVIIINSNLTKLTDPHASDQVSEPFADLAVALCVCNLEFHLNRDIKFDKLKLRSSEVYYLDEGKWIQVFITPKLRENDHLATLRFKSVHYKFT